MLLCNNSSTFSCGLPLHRPNKRTEEVFLSWGYLISTGTYCVFPKFSSSSTKVVIAAQCVENSRKLGRRLLLCSEADENRKEIKKPGKREHHLWKKRDSAGSGQKALNVIRIISDLPNEKEAVYGALNKWVAWETEFPVIAAAKALRILRKRSQWRRVVQVAKWLLSKGQCTTMATYDTLLLAFDKDGRVDEAESFWNMIVLTHTRSIPKRLFSRMISLYDHHNLHHKIIEFDRYSVWGIIGLPASAAMSLVHTLGIDPKTSNRWILATSAKSFASIELVFTILRLEKLLQVFADMEELRVRPDEDTTRRVARAFGKLGQEDKQRLVLKRYLSKFKYIHSNGERVRVKRHFLDDE